MLLFESGSFGNDARGWKQASTECHAEIASLRASLRAAQDRESTLRRRVEFLESSQRAGFKLAATFRR